jgi:Cu/Ag efflux pump CusA
MRGRYLDIDVDRHAAARHGLSVDDVQMAMVAAVGGTYTGEAIEGRERYSMDPGELQALRHQRCATRLMNTHREMMAGMQM